VIECCHNVRHKETGLVRLLKSFMICVLFRHFIFQYCSQAWQKNAQNFYGMYCVTEHLLVKKLKNLVCQLNFSTNCINIDCLQHASVSVPKQTTNPISIFVPWLLLLCAYSVHAMFVIVCRRLICLWLMLWWQRGVLQSPVSTELFWLLGQL